jgi:hypothetical protein
MTDLSGTRFGRWRVIGRSALSEKLLWYCICDCGTERDVDGRSLRRGASRSCGCLSDERSTVHADSSTPEYQAWVDARARCHDPQHHNYPNYGARGIQMWPAWREDYSAWLEHVGRRPSTDHQIDRIDNNLGYQPGNLRWVSRIENVNNRRVTKMIEYGGETKPLMEWARQYGLTKSQLHGRLFQLGWDVEKALTTPGSVRRRSPAASERAGERHA